MFFAADTYASGRFYPIPGRKYHIQIVIFRLIYLLAGYFTGIDLNPKVTVSYLK